MMFELRNSGRLGRAHLDDHRGLGPQPSQR